jgi:TRAP-type mannitol/chloroaromatic compound transport system substrate-binding protein
MTTTTIAKALAVAGVSLGLAITATTADAQKRVRWKMQSTWGAAVPHLGTSGVRFSNNIDKLSGGSFQMKFHEPNALVPSLECFDAASKGSVDSCYTTPGYHTGKLGPGVSFFTAVPYGPGIGEMMAWKRYGGGDEIRAKKYAEFDLVAFDVLAIGPETSGWFKFEVKSLDQLRGLKMRFFGLGAKVMQKLGVSTQLLAGGDIYPALEKGVIDATEFSMPNMDIKYGFYQIAKFNYYPGWHQQVSVSEILMNKTKFDALPDQYKTIIEVAAGDNVMHTYAETEALNPAAMNEMLDKYGVQNKRWGDAELATFEKAWNEVVVEESANDAFFKEIADSYFAFRKVYRTWGTAQSLDSTYLK